MNCQQILEQLPALAYGDLQPPIKDEIQQHLNACPACQKEYGALSELRQLLDAAPAPEVKVDFAELYSEAGRREGRQLRRWRRAAVGLLAAAATLLVVLLLQWEIRLENQQLVLRWGAPAPVIVQKPLPPPTAPIVPPPQPPIVKVEDFEQIKELVLALVTEVNQNDGQHRKALVQLQDRLDRLQKQSDSRWSVTKRDMDALYLVSQKDKGERP